uniref:Endonuclease/exonuclease/phosphatase domain-containing protein n=1 Tax=Xenopus tropicalis TaxID=8364 RepID=A0A803KAU7_XENTR
MRFLHTFLEPKLDCSAGASSLPFTQIKRIKRQLHSLQLLDSWRIFCPQDKNYTFYLHSHDTYSRIDYIFSSHKALDEVQKVTIGSITWSDHAPVFLDPSLNITPKKHFSWKINDSLLRNPDTLETLTKATKEYFENNTNTASNAILEWEAYKCFIRGIAIQQGEKIKREKKQELLLHIKNLELSHKTSRTSQLLTELTIARQELKSILQTETNRASFLLKKMFYDHGNKCSKMLARMLKAKEQKNHIFKMKSSTGQIYDSPKEIHKILTEFYRKHYQITNQNVPPPPSDTLHTHYENYIAASQMGQGDQEWIDNTEIEMSTLELEQAIKSSPTGKCPGPDRFSMGFYKTLKPLLLPPLTKAFNEIKKGAYLVSHLLRSSH